MLIVAIALLAVAVTLLFEHDPGRAITVIEVIVIVAAFLITIFSERNT